MKALNFEEVKIAKQALTKPKLRISLVLDCFRSDDNIAHAFRLADALSIDQLYIIADKEQYNWNTIERKSRSCSKHIPYTIYADHSPIATLNYDKIIALEWTDKSTELNRYTTDCNSILLVLGNEKSGINKELLSLCNASIHIPMYGNNSSMNVMMAASIAVHTLLH